jgi:hypothetical protein
MSVNGQHSTKCRSNNPTVWQSSCGNVTAVLAGKFYSANFVFSTPTIQLKNFDIWELNLLFEK